MKPLLLTLTLLSVLATAVSGGDQPSWVEKRPTSKEHYVGIGAAAKKGAPEQYRQRARENALSDIAVQIAVAISGEQTSVVNEQLGKVREEFQSQLTSSTMAELEDVEVVDTWDGDNDSWVYCRLSIAAYREAHARRVREAAGRALDFYSKARTSEASSQPVEALQYYMQSLAAIAKYAGESVQVEYQGKTVYIVNELFGCVQSLLNRITLAAVNGSLDGQVGAAVRQPLAVTVALAAAENRSNPLANCPVRFAFIRGNGELVAGVRSDPGGTATTRIARITATDKLQMIRAEVDLAAAISNDSIPPVLRTLLKSFTVPSDKFVLTITGVAVCFTTEEHQFGEPMRIPRIEPALKSILSNEGFSFVSSPSKASFVIRIAADSRQGSEVRGLYVSFADATVSVVDLNSGDEIYKNSVSSIKGISDTYEKASVKAFDEIAGKFKNEIVPLLLERIRK